MKIQLNNSQLDTLREHSKKGRSAWGAGNIEEAERHFILAWSIIPEPKADHDYAQSLSRGLLTFFRDTKQFDKAKAWTTIMAEMYGSSSDLSVQFLAATIHFEAGEFDYAYELFLAQYKSFGKRPFEGEDKKYLDFVLKRTTRK
ncbi:TPA: hypothetical protein SMI57_004304 [Serratia liquefaciens]|nr:hypothetical protein [Serratia liquefaciens]